MLGETEEVDKDEKNIGVRFGIQVIDQGDDD